MSGDSEGIKPSAHDGLCSSKTSSFFWARAWAINVVSVRFLTAKELADRWSVIADKLDDVAVQLSVDFTQARGVWRGENAQVGKRAPPYIPGVGGETTAGRRQRLVVDTIDPPSISPPTLCSLLPTIFPSLGLGPPVSSSPPPEL